MSQQGSASAVTNESPDWLETLTTGHGWPRGFRAVFQRLPRAPRCKICATPFHGIGGKLAGLAGFRPSRKNPFICGRCIDHMPPGGATVDIAVLFADVRGSTALGENLQATAYAELMNRFYTVATGVLLDHDALIDKLIGDEVMALFIRGISGPDYHRKAIDAGLALLSAVTKREGEGLPIGIAVHSGSAFVGNVGAGGITDFTALGDTVNIASRLQAIAVPGELVVSRDVQEAAGLSRLEGESRTVSIRGREEPIEVSVVRL